VTTIETSRATLTSAAHIKDFSGHVDGNKAGRRQGMARGSAALPAVPERPDRHDTAVNTRNNHREKFDRKMKLATGPTATSGSGGATGMPGKETGALSTRSGPLRQAPVADWWRFIAPELNIAAQRSTTAFHLVHACLSASSSTNPIEKDIEPGWPHQRRPR